MSAMASEITGASIVCSTVCSNANQRKYQSSTSLAFVRGFHRSPVDSPHKGPVTQKMFPFGDVIMSYNVLYECAPTQIQCRYVVEGNYQRFQKKNLSVLSLIYNIFSKFSKLQSDKISLIFSTYFNGPPLLKFCTHHGSVTTEIDVIKQRHFVRFLFKISDEFPPLHWPQAECWLHKPCFYWPWDGFLT